MSKSLLSNQSDFGYFDYWLSRSSVVLSGAGTLPTYSEIRAEHSLRRRLHLTHNKPYYGELI